MYTFADGVSIIGADNKSFYIPDSSTYLFDGSEQTFKQIKESLSSCFAKIEGKNEIIKQATPPTDNSIIWQNTNDNLLYYFDGVDWLSIQEFYQLFTEEGGSPNNVFLKFGTVRTTLTRGFAAPFDLKLNFSAWRNPTGAAVVHGIFVSGVPSATISTTAAVYGTSVAAPSLTIAKNDFISIQYIGANTNNIFSKLYYRKKW